MSSYNRNPGNQRGFRPPNPSAFLGRSGRSTYQEWKERGQLWPGSPPHTWSAPPRGSRGLGPRVGMTLQQRSQWETVQNYGIRPQPSRVLVPVAPQRFAWPVPTLSAPHRGTVRPASAGTPSTNIYAIRDKHSQEQRPREGGYESGGRSFWPGRPRNPSPHGSVLQGDKPKTDIFRASGDSKEQRSVNSSKPIVCRSFSNLVSGARVKSKVVIKQEAENSAGVNDNKKEDTSSFPLVDKEKLSELSVKTSEVNDNVASKKQPTSTLGDKSCEATSSANQCNKPIPVISQQVEEIKPLKEDGQQKGCNAKAIKQNGTDSAPNNAPSSECIAGK